MTKIAARRDIEQRIIAAGQSDHRIAGLVDFSSSGDHSSDAWSDIDVAIFLHDVHFETFTATLPEWLAQLGVLLLFMRSETMGHPLTRVVYDVGALPLRVDMLYYRLGEMDNALRWPEIPTAQRTTIWHDATHGQLTLAMQQLTQQDLRPADFQEAFEQMAAADPG